MEGDEEQNEFDWDTGFFFLFQFWCRSYYLISRWWISKPGAFELPQPSPEDGYPSWRRTRVSPPPSLGSIRVLSRLNRGHPLSFLSVLIQMPDSSRVLSQTHPEIMFYQPSAVLIIQASWHIKLIIAASAFSICVIFLNLQDSVAQRVSAACPGFHNACDNPTGLLYTAFLPSPSRWFQG